MGRWAGLAGVITENRAASSGSAAADFVSVLARGSGTDVISTDSGSLVFAAAAAAASAAASRAACAPCYLLQLPRCPGSALQRRNFRGHAAV